MAKKDNILRECFYCGITFSTARSAEGDHFPTPKRFGGLSTVPACRTCHEAKDNIGLKNWSIEMWNEVLADFPKMSVATRLFIGKVVSLGFDLEAKEQAMRRQGLI